MRKVIFVPQARVTQDAAEVLTIIRTCERMHVLPHNGGLLDQDSLFVEILHQVFNWDGEKEQLDRRKAEMKRTGV